MSLQSLRAKIADFHLKSDQEVLRALQSQDGLSQEQRHAAQSLAQAWVEHLRAETKPSLMEAFFAEYGLSDREGVALMQLAEALLRVPDAATAEALIEDKLGQVGEDHETAKGTPALVKGATAGLGVARALLNRSETNPFKRLGKPMIRQATTAAMKVLGDQFVCGQSMPKAMKRAARDEALGYTYSYDMLGEAAQTAADARAYLQAYENALDHLAKQPSQGPVSEKAGISIKLSALHPRYESLQHQRVMQELVPIVVALCRKAKQAGLGLNIDAEEADRLEISLDLIEAVARHEDLAGWDGLGVVVQTYSKRAGPVIDWLYGLAEMLDRRFMVRLVKGAYWDSEIKRAQVEGLSGFPVFAQKVSTDVSYLCCASKLLKLSDRLYPQFATHNAHSLAAILTIAEPHQLFEFQRLFGMGENLHAIVTQASGRSSRIYAPVGEHSFLLAYLVRRLLENGANSSFVQQVRDPQVEVSVVTADPFADPLLGQSNERVTLPEALFAPGRKNSKGFDTQDPWQRKAILTAMEPFKAKLWQAKSLTAVEVEAQPALEVRNPWSPTQVVGLAHDLAPHSLDGVIEAAKPWAAAPGQRAEVLNQAADKLEQAAPELFALLAREAGKTLGDAVAELREAVDFLRFYAHETERRSSKPLGVFTCISPWNFPLAIFLGQISAALAAGNAVVAKPAEATPLIAARAVSLLHEAGVPIAALQLVLGTGKALGSKLASHPSIDGLAFTGSTATGQHINRTMAANLAPSAPLIAETGGLNAMIVDSTALPQQAVEDIVISAFQSAGQRCSALRLLFLQEDCADDFLDRLFGVMDQLKIGDPFLPSTDIGPLISDGAAQDILSYVERHQRNGSLLKTMAVPSQGHFVPPTVIQVDGMDAMEREVFGPVLHVVRFQAGKLADVIEDVNAAGYGLTFGLQTRIDRRVAWVAETVSAGNVYVNRNQIGAVVGSQPFGGHGLSGTGPKAGGPRYLDRFRSEGPTDLSSEVQALPGPTGELNAYRLMPRGPVLCLGPSDEDRAEQERQAQAVGCSVLVGGRERLAEATAVAFWGGRDEQQALRRQLADLSGPIIPLLTSRDIRADCQLERHLCVNTAAAGGDVGLMA